CWTEKFHYVKARIIIPEANLNPNIPPKTKKTPKNYPQIFLTGYPKTWPRLMPNPIKPSWLIGNNQH
ncbi:hypothetical protein ACVGXE_04570, partial [Escherichia coli]